MTGRSILTSRDHLRCGTLHDKSRSLMYMIQYNVSHSCCLLVPALKSVLSILVKRRSDVNIQHGYNPYIVIALLVHKV